MNQYTKLLNQTELINQHEDSKNNPFYYEPADEIELYMLRDLGLTQESLKGIEVNGCLV